MEVISVCSEVPSDEVSVVRTEVFYKYANLEDIPTFTSVLGQNVGTGGSTCTTIDENSNTQVQPTSRVPPGRTESFYRYSCLDDIPSFEFRQKEQVENGQGCGQQNSEICQLPTRESLTYVNDDGIQVEKLRSSSFLKLAMATGYEKNGEDLVERNSSTDGTGGGVGHGNEEGFDHGNDEGFVHLNGITYGNDERFSHFHGTALEGFIQQTEGGFIHVDENLNGIGQVVDANNCYEYGNTSLPDLPRFDDRNAAQKNNAHQQEIRRRARSFDGNSAPIRNHNKSKRGRNNGQRVSQDVRADARFHDAFESASRGNWRPDARNIEEREPITGWIGNQHGVLYTNPQAYSDMGNAASNNIYMGNTIQREHLNLVHAPNHVMHMPEEFHKNDGSPTGHSTVVIANTNDPGFRFPFDPRNNGCTVVPWGVIQHPLPMSSNGLYYGPQVVVPQAPVYVPNSVPLMRVPQMFSVNQQGLQ